MNFKVGDKIKMLESCGMVKKDQEYIVKGGSEEPLYVDANIDKCFCTKLWQLTKKQMKKYRLLKDIPGIEGIIKAGLIFTENSGGKFHQKENVIDNGFSHEFIQNNPEFFGEVTRWKPEDVDRFYYIHINGEVEETVWYNTAIDQLLHSFGNYFKTYELAGKARDGIQAYLLQFHEENL